MSLHECYTLLEDQYQPLETFWEGILDNVIKKIVEHSSERHGSVGQSSYKTQMIDAIRLGSTMNIRYVLERSLPSLLASETKFVDANARTPHGTSLFCFGNGSSLLIEKSAIQFGSNDQIRIYLFGLNSTCQMNRRLKRGRNKAILRDRLNLSRGI